MTGVKVGDLVKLGVPAPEGEVHFARGRVVALEVWEDDEGIKRWVYVRWFDANGRPDSEPLKHSLRELDVLGVGGV